MDIRDRKNCREGIAMSSTPTAAVAHHATACKLQLSPKSWW